MGRPKGSANKESSKAKKSAEIKEEVKSVAVPIMEAPLMIFVCRRCSGNFNSTEDYQQHSCPAQMFAIVEEKIAEVEEKPTSKSSKKSPKKSNSEKEEVADTELSTESAKDSEAPKEKFKKPRKPYKKREKPATEEPKDPIACPSCKKVFTRKYHLERHLTHTQCNPGTFKKEEFNCEVCNKVFSRIDNLRMHLRAHLGEKSRSRGET